MFYILIFYSIRSLNIDEMNEKDQNIEKLHTSTNFYLAQVYGHIDNMAKVWLFYLFFMILTKSYF